MKLLFEDSIPFGQEYFAGFGEAKAYNWQTIQPEDLKDVEVLAVRSTTVVNAELLQYANALKFVCTATAGTNHLDKTYLDSTGIAWSSAEGCNAVAVAEYVVSALLRADNAGKTNLRNSRVGIVGAGFVGTALSHLLDALNIPYLLCDPPLQAAGDPRPMVDLQTVLNCEVISLHVPLITEGAYPTRAMVNEDFLSRLHPHQLLINACRGEVVDEAALLARLSQQNAPTVILDVFNNEPEIDSRMLDAAWLATPHIAGHSIEGKTGGTQVVYEKICQRFGFTAIRQLHELLPPPQTIEFKPVNPESQQLELDQIRQLYFLVYDIQDDDRHFRQAMAKSSQFAALRKHYRVRRECSAYRLSMPEETSAGIRAQLSGLGFIVNGHLAG